MSNRHRRIHCWIVVAQITLGMALLLVSSCRTVRDESVAQAQDSQTTVVELDLSGDGTHRSGPWVYEYSVHQKGTRSEGYHGKLLFDGREVPEPANLNDYYETPWVRMYWVGRPMVLFGGHGWMTKPLASRPEGQALADPSTLVGRIFNVEIKVLTAEELRTPDRVETDPQVLALMKDFGLTEVHVQGNWFGLTQTWVTLHDTKRWGHLEMRLAESDPNRPLALEFRCTSGFEVTTSARLNSLEGLLSPMGNGAQSQFAALPPQTGAVRAIKCSLTPIVGDDLDLFLVCRVGESKPRR